MEKFTTTLRGYDKEEVNEFIDKIIARIESMVTEIDDKDKEISNLKNKIDELEKYVEKLKNQSMNDMEISQDIIKKAKDESEKIIKDANLNADIIINECLMKAKKYEIKVNKYKNDLKLLKQKKETLLSETNRESMVGGNR